MFLIIHCLVYNEKHIFMYNRNVYIPHHIIKINIFIIRRLVQKKYLLSLYNLLYSKKYLFSSYRTMYNDNIYFSLYKRLYNDNKYLLSLYNDRYFYYT